MPGNLSLCVVCSYFKRQLDTMNRYTYIKDAYKNMATWMMQGNDAVKRLKRYIHRHLALPQPLRVDPDEAADIYHHFGWHYVDALLSYCSDDHKESTFNSFHPLLHTRTPTHSEYFIMRASTSSEFRKIPVGKVSVNSNPNTTHCLAS